jgi:hypothetical protein
MSCQLPVVSCQLSVNAKLAAKSEFPNTRSPNQFRNPNDRMRAILVIRTLGFDSGFGYSGFGVDVWPPVLNRREAAEIDADDLNCD